MITTFGVGALVDLPEASAIVGGLDGWPASKLEEIQEPRLAARLARVARLASGHVPRLLAPPADSETGKDKVGIPAPRFPRWFVEQRPRRADFGGRRTERSRRLAPRSALDNRFRFERRAVVATRFVRGCPRGHVDDLDWRGFAHKGPGCAGELTLVETGPTGDLSELRVRCSCGAERIVAEAKIPGVLGTCSGKRPWLGKNTAEDCSEKARLLIRTATNAWFPQLVSVLSLPQRGSELDKVVEELWDDLRIAKDAQRLSFIKEKPDVAARLERYSDEEVLRAIQRHEARADASAARPLKEAELEAILSVPEGFGDEIPPDRNFHARRLPAGHWRRGEAAERIASVVRIHRLREVTALAGFTRFEAVTRDIDGEYATDVERAALALEQDWFPAVENRGEGVFLEIAADAMKEWAARRKVKERVALLASGHEKWNGERERSQEFPGGPYVLLHTLAHLLIQSVSLRCGYPTASIRERIYVDNEGQRFGLLLFTASSDAEGTLGGLVEQAQSIAGHLEAALRTARLCSSDPICAHHRPGESLEERWLHGAACHGCTLVAETSCEMHNDYLDRALVAPVIGCADAAFFRT